MEWDDEAPPGGLDLPRLFAAVARRKRWILMPTLAAFLCGLAFVALVKPRYTATTKVMLENGENYFTRPDKAAPDSGVVYDDMTVESEAEAAASPDVERQAMARLKPEDLAEFSGGGGLLSAFTDHSASPEDRRLVEFGKRVQVYPQMKTRVLLFEYYAHDRARAARGADALAEAYLDSQRLAKDAEAKRAAKWLSDQIDAQRARVADAESQVESLRAQSGLLAGASGLAVPSQQLSEIAGQIATARAAAAAASAKASALRDLVRSGRLDDVASVAGDDSLRRYGETRVALKAQMAELGRTLLPGHPRMKELAGQLAGLDQEIRAAAMKRVHGFEEEARIAGDQVKSLDQAVSAQARTVTSNDADRVKLRELEIDARTASDQLESYLTKYREALARNAVNGAPANGRIIAYALTPAEATFPRPAPTLFLATLAGFLVSLGLVVARILLTDGAPQAATPAAAKREPRLKRESGLPFGIDPLSASAPEAERQARPEQDCTEARDCTKAVECFVDRLAAAGDGDSLPFLVAGEGAAGALPAALVAARRLSRAGPTALLDLGPSPSWLADAFDREADRGPARAGLSDFAEDLAAVAHRDLSTSLDIIPSGASAITPEALAPALEALMDAYDFVVVHAPDWRDPLARSAAGDMAAMLLVTPEEEISAAEARARAAFRGEGMAIKAIGAGSSCRPEAA
jgi:succinoglycan biosynthesis transport protein ExoP